MKKAVINVPKDKCPLDHLAQMGKRTKNAWIFLHENVRDNLRKSCAITYYPTYEEMSFEETEEHPATILEYESEAGVWARVFRINAEDIAFKEEVQDPDEIYFLKMAEK